MSVASQYSKKKSALARALIGWPHCDNSVFSIVYFIVSVSIVCFFTLFPNFALAAPTNPQGANMPQGNYQKKDPAKAGINLRAPTLTVSGTEPAPRQIFKPIKLTAPLLTVSGTEPPPRGVFHPIKIIAPSLTVSGQDVSRKKE